MKRYGIIRNMRSLPCSTVVISFIMVRDQAESGLRFLGLIIFENKLKPGTAPAIQTLRSAHLAIRMATGDNHRTAISVARECGLISQSMHVFFPVFVVGQFTVIKYRLLLLTF